LKIVYHCYGGAHASPTAAAIHLEILAPGRRPASADFDRVPYYDRITRGEHGKLIRIGVDAWGHEIYIMGRRNSPQPVIAAIREFLRLNGEDPSQYYFVDCVQLHNLFMVAGGFSSRAMGWVRLGGPLVRFGTRLSFGTLEKIVRKTIKEVEGMTQ
jgi:hypothetical protein